MEHPAASRSEVRIDLVSPLPPVRSGIADYSVDLLPHLAERCDIRVVQLPGQPISEDLQEKWRPVPVEVLGENGRIPLYQMGNNHHHESVEDLALLRPGILTLHDLVLHHLLIDRSLGRNHFEPFFERMRADHGWIGEAVARPRRWRAGGAASQFSLPCHRRLLRRQRGVLVHSEWARDLLLEEDPELRVRSVPMGIPMPEAGSLLAGLPFRKKWGLPVDRPVLGSFGFQTPIKRTMAVIEALARPELADCWLLVAGEVAAILDLEAGARQAGVADRVRITGFLDYEDFQSAIAACDLAVNLRYPTAGETSASLLRILAVGRPVVVSDYAQFEELPHEVAVRVPLGEGEPEALAAAVKKLLDSPGCLDSMRLAARKHVLENHSPGRAAEAVVAACRDWANLEPPGDSEAIAPVPSSLTWESLPGELAVRGAELPWQGGTSRRLRISVTNRGPARWLAGHRGPGGMILRTRLLGRRGEVLHESRKALPWDLEAGQDWSCEMALRRPPGRVWLEIAPLVWGGLELRALDGPSWEREI